MIWSADGLSSCILHLVRLQVSLLRFIFKEAQAKLKSDITAKAIPWSFLIETKMSFLLLPLHPAQHSKNTCSIHVPQNSWGLQKYSRWTWSDSFSFSKLWNTEFNLQGKGFLFSCLPAFPPALQVVCGKASPCVQTCRVSRIRAPSCFSVARSKSREKKIAWVKLKQTLLRKRLNRI